MTRANQIYQSLLNGKIGDCEITDDDQKYITEYIQCCLDEGWTANEVYSYLSVTENFNTEISEDLALKRMARIQMTVKERINSKRV